VSLRGETAIEPTYYQCQQFGRGYFPLEEQLKLNRSADSPKLDRRMVCLSGLLPVRTSSPEQCAVVFEENGERLIASSSNWRQSQRHGERLQAYVEQQRQQVSVERVAFSPDSQLLASGSLEGYNMLLWDTQTDEQLAALLLARLEN
jgi:hypothetical protein